MRIARSFLAITITAATLWMGCGGSTTTSGGGGGSAASAPDRSGSGGPSVGGGAPGGLSGASGANITTCASAADACQVGTDCCSHRCVGGKCSVDQCVSDGAACTSDDACCSGSCGADQTCSALNDRCKTSGNECASNNDCCSGLCDASNHCQAGASFCIQPGDACGRDSDCCTADCVIESGHTIGACAAPPTGPSYCDKVDGMLCNGCGDCCSRLCAPGPSGVSICQPASGCHVTGDLCLKDTDCCGGDATSGLPGAGNGKCQLDAGAKIGICTNPMNGGSNACNPEGNVCHYLADAGYACTSSSARSDCCGDERPKSLMCKLDALGVPRCLGVGACHEGGDVCASAADCCDNAPCVPDSQGALHCSTGGACVPGGGGCTINADCCPGGLCHRDPGSTAGTCTTGGTGTGSGGAGNTGGASNSGGLGGAVEVAGGAGAPSSVCAQYGQICAVDGDCCNGVPCTGGICVIVVK